MKRKLKLIVFDENTTVCKQKGSIEDLERTFKKIKKKYA